MKTKIITIIIIFMTIIAITINTNEQNFMNNDDAEK